ncbi:MAG: hemerythrin domain-containing protein [Myxococcota bacterium]|nr:hemerythrin domain-containing protein [Myxococcota bacterium]
MKRHPRLRGLSDDHHTSLIVALRCKRADEGKLTELWQAVRDSFATHLEPHFAIEEAHLLPGLEAIGEDAMAARIRADHERLRRIGSEADPDLARVHEFGRLLDEHVRFEEREVFEQSQERLEPACLAALEAACEATPRLCAAALVAPEASR